MVTCHDVAKYILEKKGPMPAMKLQKLVYYCQAWSLVWDGVALFNEEIEAWANGPVVRALYDLHRGMFIIKSLPKAASSKLTPLQKETIDSVLNTYGDKTPQWLSDLTHMEDPWLNTRRNANLTDGERGNAVISHAEMYNYYDAISHKL